VGYFCCLWEDVYLYPVIVQSSKEGYAIYVRDGGTFENDIWCVVLCEGGDVRHYRSDQIKVNKNLTFYIKPIFG
jgi:hypothetical protein